jgi:hypothetical protein
MARHHLLVLLCCVVMAAVVFAASAANEAEDSPTYEEWDEANIEKHVKHGKKHKQSYYGACCI